MKVLVGSENPVKIEAVREAFSKYFDRVEVIGIKVDSGVSNEPIGDDILDGAKNRALEVKRVSEESGMGADFFVGAEGGIKEYYSRWFAFGGMCIIDRKGREGFGTSPHFPLPEEVTKKLLEGKELGDVTDEITGDENTKQKGGAIGFFTRGAMDRKELYVNGLVVALIPFLNEKMFFKK